MNPNRLPSGSCGVAGARSQHEPHAGSCHGWQLFVANAAVVDLTGPEPIRILQPSAAIGFPFTADRNRQWVPAVTMRRPCNAMIKLSDEA